MARQRIFGRSPLGVYLRLNESIWRRLPLPMRTPRAVTAYGRLMHSLVRLRGERRQWLGTYFLRNRPQLRLICRLADRRRRAGAVRMAVLGCSIGADVYSILWSIHSTHPDLRVVIDAVDISEEVLEVAREGVYSRGVSELVLEPIFERMSEGEIREMFDEEGKQLRVKPLLREGIAWRRGDVCDPEIVDRLGRQDLVVANDFLCHMEPVEAEGCLRDIARLVDPGGYLVVSGIDLDVRTRVAKALCWTPVTDLMEDIHDGDRSLRLSWPWRYWGLEPFDKSRPDWRLRYASAFQVGATS
jgi:SAM-dependent methyltransferase